MLYFQFVVVAAVFGAIAWVAAGRGGGLDDPRQDRPEPALADDRQLGKDAIDGARFAVSFRGYRMDQVDRLLDRVAAEIDHRDRLIAELQPRAGARYGEGVSYEPVGRGQETAGAGAGTVSGTPTETATVAPGFGPGVGAAGAAGAATAADTEPIGDHASGEENPLSAWYRPTDEQDQPGQDQ